MEYTILHHMQKHSYQLTIDNPPYKLEAQDLDEINQGTYFVTPESIKRVVIKVARELDLLTPCRKRAKVDQRRYLFIVLKQKASLTLEAIGEIFGKDHATVLHGIRTGQALVKDPLYNANIKDIKEFFEKPKYVKYI